MRPSAPSPPRQPEVAATFNISSIPTLMIIRDNIVLYSQAGALPEAALEELITKAEALDMDEVPGEHGDLRPGVIGARSSTRALQTP